MATARITLIGLYNYDPTIFDDVSFPSGINKEIAVDNILIRCGESPVLYPNAAMMKRLVKNTGAKWYDNIERMLLAIDSEYNPIYNYDRHEEWHEDDKKNESAAKTNSVNDSHSNTVNGSHDVTNTETHDFTMNGSTTTTSEETNSIESDKTGSASDTVSKTTENQVSAFNDSNYQPNDKTIESGTNSSTNNENITTESTNNQSGTGTNTQRDAGEKINRDAGSNTQSDSGTASRSESGNNTLLTDNDLDHNGHLYGNIGVTTTQSMITDEIELRKKINIYDVIAEIFFKELCIYIY